MQATHQLLCSVGVRAPGCAQQMPYRCTELEQVAGTLPQSPSELSKKLVAAVSWNSMTKRARASNRILIS